MPHKRRQQAKRCMSWQEHCKRSLPAGSSECSVNAVCSCTWQGVEIAPVEIVLECTLLERHALIHLDNNTTKQPQQWTTAATMHIQGSSIIMQNPMIIR